jgi:hypothetical protein
MSSTGWTLERREKQREVAKRLVEEGKFGGKGRGQGRPRNIRASEVIAERASKEGEAIFERLMEITRGGKNSDSIAAARTLLETEEKERKLQIEDEKNIEDMHRNDLLSLVWDQLQELGGGNDLTIVEGEFAEIEKQRASGIGEELEASAREE